MFLSTVIAILFALLVVIMTAITITSKKTILKVLAALIGVVATIIMAIVFHSWLFALWAAALAFLVFLVTIAIIKKKAILIGIFVLATLAAIVVGVLSTRPIILDRLGMVGGPSTIIPVDGNCQEAVVIESQTHGGKVEADLNDGDPFNYALTIVSPNTPSSTETLVVLTEPGNIFDVVHPVMYFTSYRLDGTLDQALCSASKLAGNKAFAYIFVGKAATPEGWTTVSTTGWWTELVEKQYSEEAITIGVDSPAFQISADDKKRDLVSADVLHGQFWNPNVGGVVVHPQVGEGYTLSVPLGWQGTYWTIADGKPELVQARIVQTSKEVIERDALSPSNVTLLYCGATVPTTELKIGEITLKWVTSLDGWTCQVTP